MTPQIPAGGLGPLPLLRASPPEGLRGVSMQGRGPPVRGQTFGQYVRVRYHLLEPGVGVSCIVEDVAAP